MKRLALRSLLLSGALLLSGCVTAAATGFRVPRERADECRANCASLGMELGAVVIIMNAAGCVCQPQGRGAVSSTDSGAATVAGGAAIAVAAQQAQANAAAAQATRRP